VNGGTRQLRIVHAPIRTLLWRGYRRRRPRRPGPHRGILQRLGISSGIDGDQLITTEPVTGLKVSISIVPRINQQPIPPPPYNTRATSIDPTSARRPCCGPTRCARVGSGTSASALRRGDITTVLHRRHRFKVSDEVKDHATFMRCSTDHHNLVIQGAPVYFLHHSSWRWTTSTRSAEVPTPSSRAIRASYLGHRPTLGRRELLLLPA